MPTEKQPFARFRTFGLQLGLAIAGLSGVVLVATSFALQGKDTWLLALGAFGGDLLLIFGAVRKWLLFFDDQIVETDFLGPRSIAYADIKKVHVKSHGLQVEAGNRIIVLPSDSLTTPSAWVRIANLLSQVAPSAEFDQAARRLCDGDTEAYWRIIPLYWVAAIIIFVVIGVIGVGG